MSQHRVSRERDHRRTSQPHKASAKMRQAIGGTTRRYPPRLRSRSNGTQTTLACSGSIKLCICILDNIYLRPVFSVYLPTTLASTALTNRRLCIAALSRSGRKATACGRDTRPRFFSIPNHIARPRELMECPISSNHDTYAPSASTRTGGWHDVAMRRHAIVYVGVH